MTFFLKIEGLKCASCIAPMEQALLQIPGVESANVNFATETAEIKSEKGVHFEDIQSVLVSMGYHIADLTEIQKLPEDERNLNAKAKQEIEVYVAFIFAAPLFLNMIFEMTSSPWVLPPVVELIFASLVQFWPGRHFYVTAWKALKHKNTNMDTLVVLGTSAAYFFSLFSVLRGSHEIYFEASAVVIAFVLLGRYWENKAKHTARRAIQALMEQVPDKAWIKRNGRLIEVFLSELVIGDVVVVKAWERIPVDGVVTQGRTEVNEAMITGEARPVYKQAGGKVIGGTINGEGTINIKVTAVGVDSTLSKMIKLVEKAQASRPPIQKLVDKVAAIFIPWVILVSLIAFWGWILTGHTFADSLIPAVAVLVIACPCALGLATPLAVVVGIGHLAKKGILVKDLSVLESLSKVTMFVFDKTGTLTYGQFKLTKSTSLSKSQDEAELLQIAASLQQGSEHPLAKPFLKKVKPGTLLEVKNFRSLQGKGIEGKIKRTIYRLGSKNFMKSLGVKLPTLHIKGSETIVYLAKGGITPKLVGCFYLEDAPRSSAEGVIRNLTLKNIKTLLLTGDIKACAEDLYTRLKMSEYKAEVSPAEKLSMIDKLRKEGYQVAMVGDGVNDAPALAASDVGFAMASGTDVALEAAPITLMRANIGLIPVVLDTSDKVLKVIRQNLFWAFIFNIVGIGFAAFGFLSPMVAGAAMSLSSLLVVLNSLRLR